MKITSIGSRLLALAIAVIFSVTAAFAQSSGDKLYNQGLQLQKTMTVQAQNSAISKFTSAKKLYDSAAKKAQCDQAITVSRNIIKSLGSGGGGGKKRGTATNNQTVTTVKEVDPTLTVSQDSFSVDLKGTTLPVNVTTNQDSWDVVAAMCEDGTSFLTVNILGSKGFEIKVTENPSTIIREQKVIVSTPSGLTEEVTVRQSGRRIDIEANKKILKFKEKGGTQKIDISCNSDYVYEQNSDENWYVESKPSWIEVTVNERKEKGALGKLFDKGKEALTGKSKADADTKMVKTPVTIVCEHLIPGTAEAFTGSKGEVVVRAGDKTMTIHVSQLGKDSTVK